MEQISYDELMAAEQASREAGLSATALAGELTTGRFAAVAEPQEPVDWEDRLRTKRLRHLGI